MSDENNSFAIEVTNLIVINDEGEQVPYQYCPLFFEGVEEQDLEDTSTEIRETIEDYVDMPVVSYNIRVIKEM